MKKVISLLLVGLFFLNANNAFAHTGLKSSSPENGETVKEEFNQLTLTFETKIEQGSTFTLVNSAGKEVAVQNIELSDDQMTGRLSSPLENDKYDVTWQIIGADGHVIEGEYSFIVDSPVTEEENTGVTEEKATDESVTEESTQDESQEEVDHSSMTPEEHAAYEKRNSDPSTVLIPAIIILVGIIILIIAAAFIIKRKK